MNKAPMVNGRRLINRHELGSYDEPLYVVATETKEVIVFYEGDDMPQFLLVAQ